MKKTAQQPERAASKLRTLPIQDRPDKVYHDPEKKPNKLVRWYQEWQESVKRKFDDGYYPDHDRVPNVIVRFLYGIGFFLGDFVPLTLNSINGIYTTIKRLLAFIVGLLIEASTVVVLIGTISFSVAHSIELLRRAGATGGLEYVGVLMFEIVFVSSTATMTGMLMSRQSKIFKTAGFWLCAAGFLVGVGFVLWSNVSAMSSNWEGWTIGILTPVLLIIAEGIIAVRNWETGKIPGHIPHNLVQWMRENQVSYEEIMLAVEAFRKERPEMDGLPADLARMMKKHHVSTDMLKQQVQGYRTEQTGGSDTQNVSGTNQDESTNQPTNQDESTNQPTNQDESTNQPTNQDESTNQPTNQDESTNQPTNQDESTNQMTNQDESTNQPTNQDESTNQMTNQDESTNQPTNQDESTNQMTNQDESTNQPTNQDESTNQMTNQDESTNQPTNQDESTNQPTNQDESTNQPTNQDESTNQPTNQDESTNQMTNQDESTNQPTNQDESTNQMTNQDESTNQPTNQDESTNQMTNQDESTNQPTNQDESTNQMTNQDESTNQPTNQDESTNQMTNQDESTNQPTNQDESTNQPTNQEDELQRVIEVARDLSKKYKRVGRLRVEREANTTQYFARKAIDLIKQEQTQSQAS